jgi:hypothetical protein
MKICSKARENQRTNGKIRDPKSEIQNRSRGLPLTAHYFFFGAATSMTSAAVSLNNSSKVVLNMFRVVPAAG